METTSSSPRGRLARSPQEIPPQGWKDIMLRVKGNIKSDRLSLLSAAMAYFALFSLVPALSSFVLIYAWVSDPQDIANHISSMSGLIPSELEQVLTTTLGSLASTASSSLGIGAIISLLISLWAASKISKSVIEAMNIIYDEEDNRGFFKSAFLALGLTLLGIVLSILALAVIIGIPTVTNILNLPDALETGVTVGSWILLLAIFSFFLSVIYRYGPNRHNAKWRWVSLGSVVAAILWAITSLLFSWYAKEFGNFNKTYGSLASIIVLMTWFYLTSFVILLGGEINAELEHQTKRDSTTGREKPMGQRHASMADTLGVSFGKKRHA